MSLNPLLAGLEPTHPGAFLAEVVLPALKQDGGVTKMAFAEHLGMNRANLDHVLKGHFAVTPATALRLGKLIGPNPEFWMTMQANYDLRRARDELGDALEQLPSLTAA